MRLAFSPADDFRIVLTGMLARYSGTSTTTSVNTEPSLLGQLPDGGADAPLSDAGDAGRSAALAPEPRNYRGVIVVNSDYTSVSVSVVNTAAKVLAEVFLSAASADAKLNEPLAGDIVLPSSDMFGDEVVLITSGDGTMASVLKARLEKLACDFPGVAEMKLRGRQIEVFQAVMEANTLTDAALVLQKVASSGGCHAAATAPAGREDSRNTRAPRSALHGRRHPGPRVRLRRRRMFLRLSRGDRRHPAELPQSAEPYRRAARPRDRLRGDPAHHHLRLRHRLLRRNGRQVLVRAGRPPAGRGRHCLRW